MEKSRFTETQIASILNETDTGMKVQGVCRKHGISPATYYQWKSKYGGMGASELKRMYADISLAGASGSTATA